MNTNSLKFRTYAVDLLNGEVIKDPRTGLNLMIINGEVSSTVDMLTLVRLDNGDITKVPLNSILDSQRSPISDNKVYRDYLVEFYSRGSKYMSHIAMDDTTELGERWYDVRHHKYAGRLRALEIAPYFFGGIKAIIQQNGTYEFPLLHTVPLEYVNFGIPGSEEEEIYLAD